MKRSLLSLLCLSTLELHGADPISLKLIKTLPLTDVKGRIDHLAIDLKGKRLFVAALGNNTVEVLDLNAGKRLRSITGCDKPQGVLYLEKANVLFIANGGNGKLRAYDGAKLNPIMTIGSLDDADNVRYDARQDRVY